MNGATTLTVYLDAWREDSRRDPAFLPREQARAAMLAAVASHGAARRRARPLSFPPFSFRLRHGRPVLAGSLAALAAAVVVGVLGWNAPAGSPLYGVRAAKQSIALALPGANLAALHLSYAEESLADARDGVNPAASLANASAELQAAHAVLPPEHSSSLWARYGEDEAMFNRETSDLENGDHSPSGSGPAVAAPSTETPESSGEGTARPSSEPSSEPSERPTAGATERPEASPSGLPGGDDASAAPSGAPTDR